MYEEVFLEDEILLRATLHDLLKDLSSGLAQDIERVLSAPGKILSQDIAVDSHRIPRAIWALLALHIARYCQPQGDQGQAVRVALSLECLMTALDCLDDVEDTDDTFLRRSLSDARLCNVSTALLSLSHSLILSLPSTLLQQFLLFTHEHLLEAIQGQHQDLISENEPLATYSAEQALAIAHQKSGSLLSLVCHVSALAFQVPLLAESFAQLGELIGVAFQLDNDMRDYQNPEKSDVERGKKTYVAVLAAQRLDELKKQSSFADREQGELRSLAIEHATRATYGVTLYYRHQALSVMGEIEQQHGAPFPETLRSLCGLDDPTIP